MGIIFTSAMPTSSLPLPLESAADRLHDVALRAERDKARVILTSDGEPVAAVVPIEDVEALGALEAAEDEKDAAEARERLVAWEAAGRPPGIPLEELAARWGIDLRQPE
jgi:prevent-host-death family protein